MMFRQFYSMNKWFEWMDGWMDGYQLTLCFFFISWLFFFSRITHIHKHRQYLIFFLQRKIKHSSFDFFLQWWFYIYILPIDIVFYVFMSNWLEEENKKKMPLCLQAVILFHFFWQINVNEQMLCVCLQYINIWRFFDRSTNAHTRTHTHTKRRLITLNIPQLSMKKRLNNDDNLHTVHLTYCTCIFFAK